MKREPHEFVEMEEKTRDVNKLLKVSSLLMNVFRISHNNPLFSVSRQCNEPGYAGF